MTRHSLLASLLAATLAACVDDRPSAGRCTGTLGARAIDLPMDAARSQFHRDDDVLGDDDGPFVLSYGAGALVVEGQFDDLPSGRELGTRMVPMKDVVDTWQVRTTLVAGDAQGSTLTLTQSSPTRVVGSTSIRFAEGTLTCTLDLRRAYELDTDD